MSTTCLNCGNFFSGNYCPDCGQKATVKRLTASGLLVDIFTFFTNLEHGFLFTSWSFLIKPGTSAMQYLTGKRKDYQKSASFFLIWTGLYILLHNTIVSLFHYQVRSNVISPMDPGEQSNIFFRQHFTLFIIPVILYSALLVYYIMAKPKYNYIEILILSLYGSGIYFMMSFISDFLLGFIFRVNILSENVFLWQALLSTVYNFWFSFDLFKRLSLKLLWLRLISVSILIAISGWVIMFYLPMLWISFIA